MAADVASWLCHYCQYVFLEEKVYALSKIVRGLVRFAGLPPNEDLNLPGDGSNFMFT